ncbi:hypothetical protein Salat_0461500 [Sesamum alatum]|uniref:DUF868 domain-containing protein n=1 Tax=Sesamum alatum TaxID=300844 RepID=A0AAE1Z3C0_9LAMI|nr:hypothetical protein Salat_0461500 [Sesamum alatum]
MRDFGSCFSEYAVEVSDTSGSSNSNNSSISPTSIPSVQNAVTCIYRTVLSTQEQVLIRVRWSKNSLSQGLSITFDDEESTAFRLSTNPRLFRKLKGSKSFEFQASKVEVFWDLSTARYQASRPEPVDCFYVIIAVDSELSLVLGDTCMAREAMAKKLRTIGREAKFSLLSRQEHFSGNALYSTSARFSETGPAHEISIRCSGEIEGLNHPVLSVSIDGKMVIRVKKLQWNFRGNQTIFLDELLVDLMWDVHDWFHGPPDLGCGVFMFRRRSGSDSRLWMVEKQVQNEEDKVDHQFSLMICACKNR